MEIKTTLFAFIILGMIVTSAGIIVEQYNTAYSSGLTNDIYGLDKSADIQQEMGIWSNATSVQTAESGSDFEVETYRSAYGIVGRLKETFNIVFGDGGIIDASSEQLGIPIYITVVVVSMFFIALITMIISIIFRRETS